MLDPLTHVEQILVLDSLIGSVLEEDNHYFNNEKRSMVSMLHWIILSIQFQNDVDIGEVRSLARKCERHVSMKIIENSKILCEQKGE